MARVGMMGPPTRALTDHTGILQSNSPPGNRSRCARYLPGPGALGRKDHLNRFRE
jgi:hypothetical protein